MTSPRITACLAALATIGLAAAGCTSGAADRSGGDVLLVRMATIDGYTIGSAGGSLVGPETFVEQLEALSDGRIQVEVTTSYGGGAAGAETRLVKAIASGDLDGGWPASRAFAAAGISGLEPLEAPLTLTSRGAVAAVVTGPAGKLALAAFEHSRVLGLGLAAGGLRRPFATRPLLTTEDWRGARFRVFGSPVQSATVTALSGTPVEGGTSWIDEVTARRLDGAEFALENYLGNGDGTEAGQVSLNVVLWPKMLVLAMGRARYDSLTDIQRSWVDEAAARAVEASLHIPDDSEFISGLCDRGVRFHTATPAQLSELRNAVRPVIAGLQRGQSTGNLMRKLEEIADRYPMPDVPSVPNDCNGPGPAHAGPVPAQASTLPEGVYRVEIPVESVTDAGISNGPGWSGTWTLQIKDGTFALTCRPLDEPGKDCGNTVTSGVLEAGDLRGQGHRVYFVGNVELLAALSGCSNDPGAPEDKQCHGGEPYSAVWSMDGNKLTFSDATVYHLSLRPWNRIASNR